MYVSGEIAGNIQDTTEPDLLPLLKTFRGIQEKFGERYNDTFWEELKKLAQSLRAEEKKRMKEVEEIWKNLKAWKNLGALDTEKAQSEPKFGLVSDGKATVPEQLAVKHEPRHDVESVFWVLVCCLVRALPDGADDKPTEASDLIFKNMLYHEIPGSLSNRRDDALRWPQQFWEDALHPELRMLAPMIVRMCELLCINWRNRSTPSNRFLLHQGFKRLLFMQIREIGEKDIRLNMKRPRTVHARNPGEIRMTMTGSSARASGSNSLNFAAHQSQRPKRGSDSITDPGETTSSRKKPKVSHTAQVPQFTPPKPLPHLYNQLSDDHLSSSLPEVDASDEETNAFSRPLTPEIEPMERPMQLGTDDARSQEEVENMAIEKVEEALRETIMQRRRSAESLVAIHLDDEAWHQVTPKPDVFN